MKLTVRLCSPLKQRISNYTQHFEVDAIRRVVSLGDGITPVYGLNNIQAKEMVDFSTGVKGMALKLKSQSVRHVGLGGGLVKQTGSILELPVSKRAVEHSVGSTQPPTNSKPFLGVQALLRTPPLFQRILFYITRFMLSIFYCILSLFSFNKVASSIEPNGEQRRDGLFTWIRKKLYADCGLSEIPESTGDLRPNSGSPDVAFITLGYDRIRIGDINSLERGIREDYNLYSKQLYDRQISYETFQSKLASIPEQYHPEYSPAVTAIITTGVAGGAPWVESLLSTPQLTKVAGIKGGYAASALIAKLLNGDKESLKHLSQEAPNYPAIIKEFYEKLPERQKWFFVSRNNYFELLPSQEPKPAISIWEMEMKKTEAMGKSVSVATQTDLDSPSAAVQEPISADTQTDLPLASTDLEEIGSAAAQQDVPASLRIVSTSLVSNKSTAEIDQIAAVCNYSMIAIFYVLFTFFLNICLRKGLPAFLKKYSRGSYFATTFPSIYTNIERTNHKFQKYGANHLDRLVIGGCFVIAIALFVLTWNVWKLVSIAKSGYALYKSIEASKSP